MRNFHSAKGLRYHKANRTCQGRFI